MAAGGYHAWYSGLSEEAKASYATLLASGRCVACHIATKPGLFGGHPVEVLPDDTPLLNGHAKAARPFRRKAAAAPAVAPPEVDAMQPKKGMCPHGMKKGTCPKCEAAMEKKPAKKAKK